MGNLPFVKNPHKHILLSEEKKKPVSEGRGELPFKSPEPGPTGWD